MDAVVKASFKTDHSIAAAQNKLNSHPWCWARRAATTHPTFEFAIVERARKNIDGIEPIIIGPAHWGLQLTEDPIRLRAGHDMIYYTKLMFRLEPGYALLFAINYEWSSIGLTLNTRIVGANQNGREIVLSGFAQRNATITTRVKIFDIFLVKLAEVTDSAKSNLFV